jgi:GNAT superfamily N-acetyltransferase
MHTPTHAHTGNLLNISERYIADLDRNPSQALPLMDAVPLDLGPTLPLLAFASLVEQDVVAFPLGRRLFEAATSLIRAVFASKGVEMDLSNCQDAFTIDVLLPHGSLDHGLAATSRAHPCPPCPVIYGVVEYVQMRGYVWVECIGVGPAFQSRGIGSRLVGRMKELAARLGKPILLYSLMDVLSFYQVHGFLPSRRFQPKSWHIGRFLEWDPACSAGMDVCACQGQGRRVLLSAAAAAAAAAASFGSG